MSFILLMFLGILVFVAIKSKVHVDFRSFIAKTLALDTGVFGVYCFTGHQGSGKTYSLNKFIRRQAKGKKIYSNMTLRNLEYTPIRDIKHLFTLIDEKNCYIIYDEIFSAMAKSKRIEEDGTEFLSQMRKQHIIFITTAQYWLELSMTFRRFVRVQVECETRPLGKLGGILKETYFDATKMQWDQLANEYVAPLLTNKFSKYEKKYMESYDTYERIRNIVNRWAVVKPLPRGGFFHSIKKQHYYTWYKDYLEPTMDYVSLKTDSQIKTFVLQRTNYLFSQKVDFDRSGFRTLSIVGTDAYNRSLRRAFARAKLIAFFNPDLNQFITLTYKANITDCNRVISDLKIFFKSQRRHLTIPIKYLYVLELQKRGAIHVHLIASKGLQTETNKNGYLSLSGWSHGFSSVLNIKQFDNDFKPYLYLFKYMTKAQRVGNSFIHTSRNFDKIKTIDYREYIHFLTEENLLYSEDTKFNLDNEKNYTISKKYYRA